MTDFPKVVKAEMLPNVRLRCVFDNGEVRFFPVKDQLDLITTPFHKKTLRQTFGTSVFLGGVNAWMGNEVTIMENGDVKLNGLVIPGELLWKLGTRHIPSLPKEEG